MASKVGEVFYNISLSYLAGYIFYFLLTYLPKIQREKRYEKQREYHMTKIISNYENIFIELAKGTDFNFELFHSSKEDLDLLLTANSANKLTNSFNLNLQPINITEFLSTQIAVIDLEIKEILEIIRSKDVFSDEIYDSLKNFEKSNYIFKTLKSISLADFPIKSLILFSSVIWDSVEKLRLLSKQTKVEK